MLYGLGAYYLGKGIEQFACPVAIAIGVIVIVVALLSAIFIKRHEAELECSLMMAGVNIEAIVTSRRRC
jgi:hypothetical protein